MQTYDINGTDQGRNYQANVAAGVRNGSPQRKNESSVFSHLTSDGTEREGLKRRDIYDIPKPKVVPNSIPAYGQRQPSSSYEMPPAQPYGGSGAEGDELSKQFDEYYKMQQKMNQMTLDAHRMPNRGSQQSMSTNQAAPLSGFTKNHTSSNIIAHDVVDVRQQAKGNTL